MPSENEAAHHAGVIAPPPLIFLSGLAAAWALDYFVIGGTPFPWNRLASHVIAAGWFITGFTLAFVALAKFRKADTPAPPWQGTRAIVTDGIFGLTRNPMYLAMCVLYLACALVLDSWAVLAGLPIVFGVVHFGVVLREERYLEAKFGEEYRRYKAAVRRWI